MQDEGWGGQYSLRSKFQTEMTRLFWLKRTTPSGRVKQPPKMEDIHKVQVFCAAEKKGIN